MQLGDRAPFPHLRWRSYLNHAAIGPLPDAALRRLEAAGRAQATHGVAAIAELVAEAGTVRQRWARLVGVDPAGVALTGNTSDGVVAIARCLPWRRGDRVVLFEGEFPTNTTPWQQAARDFGLELRWMPADAFRDAEAGLARLQALLRDGVRLEAGLARLQALLRDGVRLVAASAVQFQTGLRLPIARMARMAHDHGAELFVDAIQAVGAVPIDLSTADHVACGGQKWLHGPMGTGVLWSRRWDRLEPRLASWLSHTEPLRFLFEGSGLLTYHRQLQQGPATVEGGGGNLAGHAAWAASLGLLDTLDAEAAFHHVQAFHDAVEPAFVARGFQSLRAPTIDGRSGILSLRPPDPLGAGELVAAFAARGVSVSSPDGLLRLSPSWSTPSDDARYVVDTLHAILEDPR